MTLAELAERCEQATGADRELDGLIEVFARLDYPFAPDSFIAEATVHLDVDEDDGSVTVRTSVGDKSVKQRRYAPRKFTASLDVAMALVPEGWGYNICPTSVLLTRSVYDSGIMARAASPTLAICAAALRARAAQAGETNGRRQQRLAPSKMSTRSAQPMRPNSLKIKVGKWKR